MTPQSGAADPERTSASADPVPSDDAGAEAGVAFAQQMWADDASATVRAAYGRSGITDVTVKRESDGQILAEFCGPSS